MRPSSAVSPGTFVFCLMTIRSLAPARAHPGETLSWEEELPFETRPSGHFLGLLGLGLALEAGTGLSSPRTQFGEGLEDVVTKTFELLALGPGLGQACESLSLPDPPKSDSKLGIVVPALWSSWSLSCEWEVGEGPLTQSGSEGFILTCQNLWWQVPSGLGFCSPDLTHDAGPLIMNLADCWVGMALVSE